MTETLEIEVPNETIAKEVFLGVLSRAGDIYENPHNENDWVARELKEIYQDHREDYDDL